MRILVSGGAGYLGAVLVPMLLQDDNNEVTVLDSFTHGVPSLLGVCHDPYLAIVRGDVRDSALLDALTKDVHAVVHLAAVVGQRACAEDKMGAFAVNAEVTQRLINTLKSDQTLIYPCTNSGYGMAGEAECDESSPLSPTSEYGLSKVLGEQYALRHGRTISLRFATLFGCSPRMRLDLLVNDFVYRAMFGVELLLYEGHFRRNFLHVRDAAVAIIWALNNIGAWKGHVFNVGDSRANMTKSGLCGTILRYSPKFRWQESTSGKDPDRRDYLVSNGKIEAAGWLPLHTIDAGIVELLKAYRQYGSLIPKPRTGSCGALEKEVLK